MILYLGDNYNLPQEIVFYMHRIHDNCQFIKCIWPSLTSLIYGFSFCKNKPSDLQCLWQTKLFIQHLSCFVNTVLVACGFSCDRWGWSGLCRFSDAHCTLSIVLIIICQKVYRIILVANRACIQEIYTATSPLTHAVV